MTNQLALHDLTQFIVDEKRLDAGSDQILMRFPNGYGASIVRGPYTYGGPEGLFELAVIEWKGKKFELCYSTPITDDVIGHLSPDKVRETLKQIMSLAEPAQVSMDGTS